MANFHTLRINNQHTNSHYAVLPSAREHEIPAAIKDADLYINHTIVVGEILGLPVDGIVSAMEMLDRVRLQAEADLPNVQNIATPIIKELAPRILDDFERIWSMFNAAMDQDGRPSSANGELLRNSSYVKSDTSGRMMFIGRLVYLMDLREQMGKIIALLKFGLQNDLLIQLDNGYGAPPPLI